MDLMPTARGSMRSLPSSSRLGPALGGPPCCNGPEPPKSPRSPKRPPLPAIPRWVSMCSRTDSPWSPGRGRRSSSPSASSAGCRATAIASHSGCVGQAERGQAMWELPPRGDPPSGGQTGPLVAGRADSAHRGLGALGIRDKSDPRRQLGRGRDGRASVIAVWPFVAARPLATAYPPRGATP